MKANKVTLIAQTIGMYVMHLPLYVLFILELLPGIDESFVMGLLITALVLMALVAPVAIANIVLSVISVFKGETDLSQTVMKVKLALIPWYVINFAMCFVIVSISFNPFMMIAIPVVIAITVGITYFFMLATSLPDVGYYLRRVFVTKEEKITASRVFVVILLFIFCLDVVGGIVFHRQNVKAELPSLPEGEGSESK